ncbi:hypothetical protein IPP75_05685 [Candidatus Saccharibacteria bacterium]|nr:MAG: hypothetical protein IPP75_05685 [Candidatus Saccharibacteria bacterium]
MNRLEITHPNEWERLDDCLRESLVHITVPHGTACWLIDRNFEAVATAATRLEAGILPINLERVAKRLYDDINEPEMLFVAVGNSAKDITGYWPTSSHIIKQEVALEVESRHREERVLRAQPLEIVGRVGLIDDVAVSGRTIEYAAAVLKCTDLALVGVGLAWDSRRLTRRLGGVPLTAAITYRQHGGGRPAVNSFGTFVEKPFVASDYASRRFDNSRALEPLIEIYKEG